MKGARGLLGIGLGFLLAFAIVAGVSFFGPTPTKAASAPISTSAVVNRESGSAGTSTVSPVVTVSPSSIEGISSSTPFSLLLLLLPLVVAAVLGIAANRLYARRADSE